MDFKKLDVDSRVLDHAGDTLRASQKKKAGTEGPGL